MRTVKRGELYFADLGTGIGSEQWGERPVLIVQNDKGNLYSDIVNNGWHIYLKDICTYATLSKVS